jgi:hypothetical protein
MALIIENTFVNGTPAVASEVNANFLAVKTFVDGLENGTNIDNGAISTTKIADNAVTKAKLADRVVGSSELDGITVSAGTTSAYTLLSTDANRVLTFSAATNVTIPASVFSIGDQINILQTSAGQVSVLAAGGVNLRSESSRTRTRGQWAMATVIQIASNEWVILGNVVA